MSGRKWRLDKDEITANEVSRFLFQQKTRLDAAGLTNTPSYLSDAKPPVDLEPDGLETLFNFDNNNILWLVGNGYSGLFLWELALGNVRSWITLFTASACDERPQCSCLPQPALRHGLPTLHDEAKVLVSKELIEAHILLWKVGSGQ
jgi:hypothetical protein